MPLLVWKSLNICKEETEGTNDKSDKIDKSILLTTP